MRRWALPLSVGVAGFVCFLVGYRAGRDSVTPKVRVEYKETVKWRERIATEEDKSANVAKQESVRVVTRWLRKDGTPAKESVRESRVQALRESTSVAKTTAEVLATTNRVSTTQPAPFAQGYASRIAVSALLGLNLREGLRREWGVSVGYRVAGPVWVTGWALPRARIGGFGVGFAF